MIVIVIRGLSLIIDFSVYYKLILQGRDEFLRNRKAAEQQGSGKLLRDRARGDKRKIKKDKGDQSYVISDQASYHHCE